MTPGAVKTPLAMRLSFDEVGDAEMNWKCSVPDTVALGAAGAAAAAIAPETAIVAAARTLPAAARAGAGIRSFIGAS